MAEETKTKTQQKPEQKPDQVEAAVKEVEEDVTRKITVRDVEFIIPPQQPAELLFAARSASRAARNKEESGAVEAMMDMAVAYVGENALRDLLAEESVEDAVTIVEELLEAAAGEYGTDQGES